MASIFDYDPNWKPEGQGSSIFDYDPNWTPPKKHEGGLVASLKQTGGQMVKSAGQLAADVLPGVDRDNALTRTGQGIIDANPTAVHSLADVADSPWTATKEAVGNAAASIGGVVGARLLGQGITAAAPLAGPAAPLVAGIGQGISWLGPTAMAALPSYGGIREQQIAADPNNEGSLASKALAGAGAATVGLIENRFGPQEWALKALSQGGRDALAKQFAANSLAGAIGKGAVKGAAIEGAEELVQNPIEQLASYQDPTTAANLQDTAFGGVMGALGGGVLGGGAGGLSRTITPSQAQQPAQPHQPAIDPNAGPLSKAASMATQAPELSPLAFTPMEPTGPELETDAQTQERLRAAQLQADAMPFEPSLSFEQGPQPVRAMNQDGMPFERISPEDYDTLNPIRAGEGELLDAERPTAGRTRAPDAIEGQAQRRIGVADDGQQGNQAPIRTLGERVQPAQGENAPTQALPPYFTDQNAEQSARKALPFATEQGAQKKAAELSKKRNEPFTVIPHPALADRFAVVPFRNLRTPNEQGQAAQLAARAQAGQQGTMPRVEQGTQQSASDGIAATAPATPVQTQPSTESVSNGLPPVEQWSNNSFAPQNSLDGLPTKPDLPRYGGETPEGSVKLNNGFDRDRLNMGELSKPIVKQSMLLEGGANRARMDAKKISDLLGSQVFARKGFDAVGADELRVVQRLMGTAAKNLKVRESVIESIPVDVMDLLARQQLTPDVLFDNPSMLKDVISRAKSNDSVPFVVDPATSIFKSFAGLSAEKLLGPGNLVFGSGDFRSTPSAINNEIHSERSLNPSNNEQENSTSAPLSLTQQPEPQTELARRKGTPQGERNGLQEEGRREEVAPDTAATDAAVDALSQEEAKAVAARLGKKIRPSQNAYDAIKKEHPDDIKRAIAGDTWNGKQWTPAKSTPTTPEQSTSDRFRAEVERRKQEREGPQQAQEQPKQDEQPSAPVAQEAQTEQAESLQVNPELESLFESLDGTSTRKANKAKKAIQADPRADKINMVQDKFLDILQALEDSGAVKINCK